jgi:polar amino acid transport system substrate-binding protein
MARLSAALRGTRRRPASHGAESLPLLREVLPAMNVRRSLVIAAIAALLLPCGARAQDALRVVTDATFPPMEFSKDGKRTGFDIELVEALGAQMGRKIEWIDIDFKGLIPALVSKRADLAMSAIYITDERRKVVDFSDPYFAGGLVVLTTRAGPIKSLKDLDGKKVTVQVGTKSVGYLKDNFPKVERVEVEKNQEMFDLVGIGRADGAVTGKPAAFQLARTRPGFRVLDQQLTTEAYGIAVRKDDPELKTAMNAALTRIKADGSFAAIVQKWFPATSP